MPEIEKAQRNFDAEVKDLPNRRYSYSFDYLMHAYMMRVFAPHFSGTSALELGCYQGAFTKRIAEHFKSVTIVDAAHESVMDTMNAVRSLDIRMRTLHSTFENALLPDTYFDAIFLIHSLEHVDDPVHVLELCRKWLRQDGRLFLAVPNAHAASRQIAEKMGLIKDCYDVTEGEKAHGHRRTYSLGTLTDDVLKAGMTVLERGGVMFKSLANFQIDQALRNGVIDQRYLEGCFALGKVYPEMCASVYAVCSR
jgi:2-polyprenyl-3-methyl-5-hydroxy-6-metoxy-1,4-benzoquinol methylase